MTDTIDIAYNVPMSKYPDNGFRIQMGNSYSFAAAPTSPPQRIFVVRVQGKRAYAQYDGTVDTNAALPENVMTLNAFYLAHQLWKTFIYPHPLFGNLNVKFNKPLELPEVMVGGSGLLPDITLEFVEQP